jgi:hypothetical protein
VKRPMGGAARAADHGDHDGRDHPGRSTVITQLVKDGRRPTRDLALVTLLLDTGLRIWLGVDRLGRSATPAPATLVT